MKATIKNVIGLVNKRRGYNAAPRINCVNGQSVSVQGSSTNYSTPRKDNANSYSKLELGFPSDTPPKYILKYAEDVNIPTDTVYGYVPIELVVDMLNEAGGIKL